MQVTQSFNLPYGWEKVAEVLVDPEFNVEREKLREGVISSEFQMIRESEGRTRFELHTTEYKRKKTGGLDTSGTTVAVTRCDYDAATRAMRWDYQGEGGPMIKLGGVYRLIPEGEATTRFVHDVTIEVKIPLIGKQIAKLIAKEFEKRDERYPRLYERFLKDR